MSTFISRGSGREGDLLLAALNQSSQVLCCVRVSRCPLAVVVERKGESFRVIRVRVVEVAAELDGAIGERWSDLASPNKNKPPDGDTPPATLSTDPPAMLANESLRPPRGPSDHDREEVKHDTCCSVIFGIRRQTPR